MKKSIIMIIILIISAIFLASSVFAQSAKEAIMALKKLEARCQAGISYREYSSALGEAKFPVNLFMESADAKKYPELTASLSKTMMHYQTAGLYWEYKFLTWKYRISKDSEKEIIEKYPDADKDIYHHGARADWGDKAMYIESLLPVVWREASKELDNATNLYVIEFAKEKDKRE